MKNCISIFLLFFLSSGCKTQKDSSIQTAVEFENKTYTALEMGFTEIKKENSSGFASEMNIESKTTEFEGTKTTETHFIEYDTTFPVNSVTGEYPKKRETKIKTIEEGTKKEDSSDNHSRGETYEFACSDSAGMDLKDNSKQDIKQTVQSEEKISIKTGKTKTIICIIAVFTVVFLGLRYIKNFR